jgi:hypothetical protein
MNLKTGLAALTALLGLQVPAAFSANLIVNGDFADGDSGFSSEYSYSANLGSQGFYYVGTDPHADNGFWSYTGGTPTGAPSENMLIVNGGSVGTNKVWYEDGLTVTPDTTYTFSVYLLNLYPQSPATLNFSIDGAALGTTFTAGAAVGTWVPFYSTWYSGSNTVANVALVDTNTSFGGNDFALDLVCLTAGGGCAVGAPVGGTGTIASGVPEPATWVMMGLGFAGFGFAGWRRSRKAAAHAT